MTCAGRAGTLIHRRLSGTLSGCWPFMTGEQQVRTEDGYGVRHKVIEHLDLEQFAALYQIVR
jgi:hypothetical protein